MDAIAHLRVFEPAEAFPAALGPVLADAAGRDRADVEAEVDRRTLARVTRRRVDPFPHPQQPDLVRALTHPDGRVRFCPDQLARRAAYSAASLERLLEPEQFAALIPEEARRRHTAALDASPDPSVASDTDAPGTAADGTDGEDLSGDDRLGAGLRGRDSRPEFARPGSAIRTRSSLWGVPHSWLLLFDPDENLARAAAQGSAPTGTEDGSACAQGADTFDDEGTRATPDRPFRARRTVDLLDALVRCGRAARILRDHAPDADLNGELTELSGWLELFGPDAVVELDYGRLTPYVWPDESPYDLWTLLTCLEEQDESTAAVAQERLNRRWGLLTLHARAN